ncbi:uncharacterized protein LOC116336810 [Contarinia nasturtii]|uniref:uncharacterized protein LOC116336810 n=1 Tax=Contarinia nasturtii TaxID=265458 RepID=UPI0012D3E986|nr:uncharacterized protein LOC116336810 [Contarinia nasturtii]
MLPDYLKDGIHKIAKTEGFIDYGIEMKAGSNHGDNFFGVLIAVTLSGTRRQQNGDIQSDELHLLCKTPPTNELQEKDISLTVTFNREIFMYTKILPAFVQFQRERGLNEADSFVSFPKMFACEKNEENGLCSLIMEDLRPKNFQMWPKEQTVPLEHELFVMRELGKFHAVSFTMKDQKPNDFREFKQLKDILYNVISKKKPFKSALQKLMDRVVDTLEKPEHKKLMQNFRDSFTERMDKLKSDPYCDEFGILTHGDCWNNNFMYQYSNEKKPLNSVYIIDWQLSHYSPPVIDLLYNIFSGTDRELRTQHYETLLKTYHTSLSETIKKLGSDPDKLYSYDNLTMQMKKYGEYALLYGPWIVALRLAKGKDIMNVDEYIESIARNENVEMIGIFDDETQAEFSRVVNGLLTDLVDYGYVKCE